MKYVGRFDCEEIYEYYFNPQYPLFHVMGGITNPDPSYEIIQNSNYFSIEYVISGSGAIQEDGKISKVQEGDFFILHPNTYQHYFSNPKDPFMKIWIIFDLDYCFIENLLKAYKTDNIFILHNTDFFDEFKAAMELLRDEPEDIAKLLENIIFNIVRKVHEYSLYVTDTKSDEIAVTGKKYIDRMINAHINIDKVCKLINISRSHFFRCFKKTFGITPAEYIMQSKIGAAKILLANTNHSISEISMRFDFSSFSHFSRTFHKYVGCTPSEYRKKNQQTHAGRIKEG